MIIVDYSQVAIQNIIGGIESGLDDNAMRSMILSSLRGYLKKFKKTYGKKIILACDGRTYWRKQVFPYYKASRNKLRKESKYDWDLIHRIMGEIKEELKVWSPFYVVDIDNCEGDDVIYVLAKSMTEKTLIISTDKDFVFLHHRPNIKQFSPRQKKFITYKNPEKSAQELVIRGDKDDGVPNILSPDDTFVTGKRQKSIMQVKLDIWLNQKPEEFCDETTIENYKRNDLLINLENIPGDIQKLIMDEYLTLKPSGASRFVKYLANKRANYLFQNVGDFF